MRQLELPNLGLNITMKSFAGSFIKALYYRGKKNWIKGINLRQFHDITFQFYKSNNINFIHFNLMKAKDTRGHPYWGYLLAARCY